MSDGGRVLAHLRIWGVRGTSPSPGAHTVVYGGNTPCVEVRAPDGALLVLDAGTGLRPLGAALLQESTTKPVHLVLSHLHGDHVIGLSQFAPLVLRASDVQVYCAMADSSTVRRLVEWLLSPPLFPPLHDVTARVRYVPWTEHAPAEISGWEVRAIPANHPGGATVVMLSDGTGPLIGYAPDNELALASNDPSIRRWRTSLASALYGVRVLLHDATYTDGELVAHEGWGHSSAHEATRFAAECDAETLLLFHHHPDRSDEELTAIVESCRALARSLGSALEVYAATEGMRVELRPHSGA